LSSTLNYNHLAQQYAENRQIHPEVFRKLLETGAIGAGSHVLEVGCGTGNYLAAVRAAVGCAGWGCDPSPGMLLKARAAGLQLYLGRAERLALPDEVVDLIFSVDVIHHVQDRPAFLREAYRVLKAGGRICTVTDSAWIIQNRQPLSTYFPETVPHELRRYPPIGQLRERMAQVGFREMVEQTVETRSVLPDIQPYRAKAFSALHLISEEAFERGLEQLERDWREGPVPWVARYLLLWGAK
jgi:ubiquinone/menaquinone biosynthesis C-methylase UbiE